MALSPDRTSGRLQPAPALDFRAQVRGRPSCFLESAHVRQLGRSWCPARPCDSEQAPDRYRLRYCERPLPVRLAGTQRRRLGASFEHPPASAGVQAGRDERSDGSCGVATAYRGARSRVRRPWWKERVPASPRRSRPSAAPFKPATRLPRATSSTHSPTRQAPRPGKQLTVAQADTINAALASIQKVIGC
jgi:hypothetical protein